MELGPENHDQHGLLVITSINGRIHGASGLHPEPKPWKL